MRLPRAVFGAAFACFFLFPASDVAAAAAGVVAVGLLPVAAYRDGTWRGLRLALIIPAAAVTADVLVFTPLTLQPDSDVAFATGPALYYLPVWALLVAAGIGARRLGASARRRAGPPA